ncbi:hypothetical protein A1QC_14190 [Vibrio rumoiensis 1S-45]|uniref:Uncharacterized protein n=1 Tax=Vibrio rumoiensis 1S-45 TaxID=1188252 RepID=A0A1E5E5G6_9VIBR|nr:hypothetical protein A1QC_14190 [Vibrio rumoiensis 1S-45]
MNIDDFILTVSISVAIGLLCGFFLRDIARFVFHLYTLYVRKPKYFQRVVFDDLEALPQDSTDKQN